MPEIEILVVSYSSI